MKIYDISQEVFGCEVYPGDRVPLKIAEKRMSEGELYNLSSFSMCAHNGTHLDAPFHFLEDGKTIDEISLEKVIGYCTVVKFDGILTKEKTESLLHQVQAHPNASKKILFKGNAIVSQEAAEVLAKHSMDLIGVELQSVGPEEAPMKVHQILLEKEVCLLEGIRLNDVEEGVYFLHAAPLSLSGCDGAPCRATLIQIEK